MSEETFCMCGEIHTPSAEHVFISNWHIYAATACKFRVRFIKCSKMIWNIFKLIFPLCHKCNKHYCPPWKMLNHAGNSYITRQKQLCHPPNTVISHMKQLYHPLVYLFCILIRSGSRSNDAVAKQSKQRSGILKRNEESTNHVFHFIWLCFHLKMSHNIYHMSSRATIPEYRHLGNMKALARYVTLCLRHRMTKRARAFVSPRGWYSGIVHREDMWYMLCDIFK